MCFGCCAIAVRGYDEERVRKLVATAPYHRLDNVLSNRGYSAAISPPQ